MRAADAHLAGFWTSVALFEGLGDSRLHTPDCASLNPGLLAVACYAGCVFSILLAMATLSVLLQTQHQHANTALSLSLGPHRPSL